MPEIASILQIASRGSKLSLALYDFAASVPAATTDASQLARCVKDLTRALWQVSASLRADARVTTPEAGDAIADIVQQCQAVFTEIEAVVPLEMVRDGKSLTYGQKWEWSEVSRAKVQYLLGHLESLKLTLDVLSQAIQSVKVIEWAGLQQQQGSHPMCSEAVSLEKMQLECLVVEQQLSFLRAAQLFDIYHRRHADSGLQLIPLDQSAQALTLFEEHAPNPSKLSKYQDSTLVGTRAANETERLAMVRRASSPYIDYLLERWTRLLEIRRSQQPRVDSDDSSDDETPPGTTYSNGLKSPPGPILTHIDEEEDEVTRSTPTSPIGIPERMRRPRAPMSPTSPSSWNGRTASYFPAPPVKPPSSTGSSPRTSFSASSTPRPVRQPNPEQVQDGRKSIHWRLRVGNKYWDHENERVINSNTQLDPSQVHVEKNSGTDILATYASETAIEDMGYSFDRVKVPRNDGGQTKMETLYCIRRALTFPEVEALVGRSNRLWEQRYKKPRPQLSHPALDRSVSSPLPIPGLASASRLQTPRDYHRSTARSTSQRRDEYRPRSSRSSPSNTSNTSDSDRDGPTVSRSRDGSRSSTRSRRDSHGSSKKGSKTGSNLSKVAAGAGVAALLEGLFEVGAAL
ncbi:hypothetical protein NA57DRAFT_60690 [Rhizodiscina lignyota]|uniref:Fungal N-terminal domain-containing protein n=1 Tax=Rhizodiscina lignyota TaxID=1504668 RepID=A0A9P4I2W1_9PEZI|nr:hypothetical protein NA57DRAFT_60690 [Rhizodiscina lignyota]